MVATSCLAANHPVLYLSANVADRYTKIYFGENQLSPGSIGILPLTSGHLNPLLRIRVRASLRFSSEFTLPKVSSPGFGSNVPYVLQSRISQLGIAFTTPPQGLTCLSKARDNNSPVHSSIGTASHLAIARCSEFKI